MQKLVLALTAAVLLNCSAAFASPMIGEPAPAFTAKDMNGADVSLADFKGKIVVLEWTSNECPFVKRHYDSGNMQSLQKETTAKGIVWLSVDSSGPKNAGYMDGPAAAEWIKTRNAAPTDLLIDPTGAVGHLYGAKTTPHMFIVDKEGKLAYAGAIDSIASVNSADVSKATNYVQAALIELEAGQPVTAAETKSYGCGVKYGE